MSISDFAVTPEPEKNEGEEDKKEAPLSTTAPSSEAVTIGEPAETVKSTTGPATVKSDFVQVEKPAPLITEASPKPQPTATSPGVTSSEAAKPVSPSTSGITLIGSTSPAASNTPPAKSADEILAGIMGNIGEDIAAGHNLKILIHGDPGSMKSSFAATAPNNLVADLDDGLISAKFSPHGVAENVKPYPWKGFEDFDLLCKALAADVDPLKWVEVFTVDTFSDVHKNGLQEVLEREYRKRPGSVNRYVPETEHHMENNERMVRIVRSLKNMNRNLIILTHSTTVEPKNKPAKTYPDFSEKLANKIEGMMDIVAYAEKRIIDNVQHMVLTFRGDQGVHTKTRLPLPNELIDPTYEDIRKVWEESKNA
jgi:hypothetical protein